MATGDDAIALAMFQQQAERDREERFIDSLTDENAEFVRRAESLRQHFLHSVQVMMTETDVHLRMSASNWVAKYAVDVGEMNAAVMKMRVRFLERNT